MASDNPHGVLFRVLVPKQHSRVTYAELLFDMMFVLALNRRRVLVD